MSFKSWLSKYKQNPNPGDIIYEQNSYPGDITYDQNPHPGDITYDENPYPEIQLLHNKCGIRLTAIILTTKRQWNLPAVRDSNFVVACYLKWCQFMDY